MLVVVLDKRGAMTLTHCGETITVRVADRCPHFQVKLAVEMPPSVKVDITKAPEPENPPLN